GAVFLRHVYSQPRSEVSNRCLRGAVDGSGGMRIIAPGSIDQYIYRSKSPVHLLSCLLKRNAVYYIAAYSNCCITIRADCRSNPLGRFEVQAQNCNTHACLGQSSCHRTTQSTTAASDDSGLVLNTEERLKVHFWLPFHSTLQIEINHILL